MKLLKDEINETVISRMAAHFYRHYAEFDQQGFVLLATTDIRNRELKARITQVTQAMRYYLPDDFEKAAIILNNSLGSELGEQVSGGSVDETGIGGRLVLSLTAFVGLYGQAHFNLSMSLLKAMTKRQTAEFDMRFFIIHSQEKALIELMQWTTDSCRHVRRLVSEATRPRLPWGVHLNAFIKDPTPIFPLLERLKDDKSEYVRKSVANNLNDISKDHPDKIIAIAHKWWQPENKQRIRLLKKACRTLIKAGNPQILSLMGFLPSSVNANLILSHKKIKIGETLDLSLKLRSKSHESQSLLINYVLHFRLKSSRLGTKVFKWKELSLKAKEQVELKKQQCFMPLSIRPYYPGQHKIEVMINGACVAEQDFYLIG